MTKKKIISLIFAFVAIFASAFTLAACQPNASKSDVYLQAAQIFQTIDQDKIAGDDCMFATQGQNDYALVAYKDDATYGYYDTIFSVAINYLKDYQTDLQRLAKVSVTSKMQAQINILSSALDDFNASYERGKQNFAVYSKFYRSDSESVVTRGALAVYNLSLREMFESVFDAANALATLKDLLQDFSALEVTQRTLETGDAIALRDRITLALASDFYQAMIVSADGKNFSSLYGAQAVQDFSALFRAMLADLTQVKTLANATNFADLTGAFDETSASYTNTKVTEFLNVFEHYQNESRLLQKSLQNFNLNDFYNVYSCNLEPYKNKNAYADKYYQQICLFFQTQSKILTDNITKILGVTA